MKVLSHSLLVYVFVFFCFSCDNEAKNYDRVEVTRTAVGEDFTGIDSGMYQLILPYKERLAHEMNEQIGEVGMRMVKNPADGSMGHWIADMIKEEGEYVLNEKADFSLINNGGMRLADVPEGPLGIVTVFELLPFDNEVVMLRLNGTQTELLLDYIIQRNQDGVSGLKIYTNAEGQIIKEINGEIFDNEQPYKVLTIDFLQTGGDGFDMLNDAEEVKNTSMLLRDLVIRNIKKQPEKLMTSTEKRIDL